MFPTTTTLTTVTSKPVCDDDTRRKALDTLTRWGCEDLAVMIGLEDE